MVKYIKNLIAKKYPVEVATPLPVCCQYGYCARVLDMVYGVKPRINFRGMRIECSRARTIYREAVLRGDAWCYEVVIPMCVEYLND